MIKMETAQEIVNQEENLQLILKLKHCAIGGVPVSVISTPGGDSFCIDPPKELVLPFLNECEKFVEDQITKLNEKAREELCC
jgi:hypothetical protein